MVDRERLDAALDEAKGLLGELLDELRGNIAEAMRTAQERQRRHGEARAQLREVERRLAAHASERDRLPQQAYVAFLDGEHEKAEKLKDQFGDLKSALEGLEKRRDELQAEIRELSPRESIPGGHPLDAAVHQQRLVSEAVGNALLELHELEQRYVIGPLVEGIKDFEGRADQLRYISLEWNRELSEARRETAVSGLRAG